jgi:hypothetical protein
MERGLLTREQLDNALNPESMTGRQTPFNSVPAIPAKAR